MSDRTTEDGDLADRVVAAAGRIDRAGVWWVLRALLAAVAVAYVVVDVIGLLLDDGPDSHVAHHLGVFEIAYAVTLLWVAVRPARARALVPFTVVLAIGMAVFAVIDIVDGHAFPLSELSHLLELAGLVLVWLLATRRGWPGRVRERGGEGPALRVVRESDSGDI
jgi:hypothetical protein